MSRDTEVQATSHQNHTGQVREKRKRIPKERGSSCHHLTEDPHFVLSNNCPTTPHSRHQCSQDALFASPKDLLLSDPIDKLGLQDRGPPHSPVSEGQTLVGHGAPAPGCSWTSPTEGQAGQGHPGSCHGSTHAVPSGPYPGRLPQACSGSLRSPLLCGTLKTFHKNTAFPAWTISCLLTNV